MSVISADVAAIDAHLAQSGKDYKGYGLVTTPSTTTTTSSDGTPAVSLRQAGRSSGLTRPHDTVLRVYSPWIAIKNPSTRLP